LNTAKEFAEKILELSAALNQMLMKINSDVEPVRTISKVTRAIADKYYLTSRADELSL
jgi:uncharacterized protein (DUF302 family)